MLSGQARDFHFQHPSQFNQVTVSYLT